MPTRSLLERLADLTDPRDPKGRIYPFVPLLALCLVAILAGHTSVAAIAQFGRLRGKRLGHALGFRRGQMPCANTLTNLLAALDADALDRVLGAWLEDRHAAGWDHVALDGKTLRGSRDGPAAAVHLLAAYAPQASAVIAQMRVEATTNEHKAALRLLGVLPPLAGTVVTADAMFTHADVCDAILRQGADYLLYAKDNQARLQADIAEAFAAAESGGFSPQGPGGMAGGCPVRRPPV
jgi:DDE_Tnp_1-associated/Transposase DDE domain